VHAAEASAQGGRPTSAAWTPVTLPDEWNRRHPNVDANTVWYRIDWRRDCPSSKIAPVALLMQSIALAVEVFVNDQFLWSDEHLTEPLSRSWNMPRYWLLPEAWLHDGVNTLWVRVASAPGQSLGLGQVFLGEPKPIHLRYENLRWSHRTLFEVNILTSTIIGVLFFCIWIVRRDQTFYGWYALSSLFWTLFIANILATSPWPFSSTLMVARVNTMALLLSVACFCVFTWRFGEQFMPRIERGLCVVTAILLAMLAIVPDAQAGRAQLIGVLVTSVIFLLNCLQFPVHAWRSRQRAHACLALSMLILPVASFHDLLLILHVIDAKPIFPYANIATTISLSAILGLRHANNLRRIERFNQELASGIEQARDELSGTLKREYALALTNTRLQDRLQIAHDLHDGLGGSLVHMMASVEQAAGPLERRQVLSMLKFIRDDLRQTIDSNSSTGVRVPDTPQEWIAPLRHRFTALFDELGIAAEWRFPPQWLTAPDALQILALTRLVEEALTNVIKHSRARRLSLHLHQPEADELILQIEDNGIGFDVAAVRQADISIGMRSMSLRIARVGGTLDVTSEPGRTVLKASLTLTHLCEVDASNN
jgi:signal transduction histidine kinase